MIEALEREEQMAADELAEGRITQAEYNDRIRELGAEAREYANEGDK